jgi:hypothetical protein
MPLSGQRSVHFARKTKSSIQAVLIRAVHRTSVSASFLATSDWGERRTATMPCLRGQLPAGVLGRNAAALNFIHRIGRPCSIFLKWPAIEVKVRFYLDPRPGAGIDLDDPVLSRYQAPRALAVIDPHLDPLVRDCLPVPPVHNVDADNLCAKKVDSAGGSYGCEHPRRTGAHCDAPGHVLTEKDKAGLETGTFGHESWLFFFRRVSRVDRLVGIGVDL